MNFNSEIYSFITIGGLDIPIHIHVSRIMDTDRYTLPTFSSFVKYDSSIGCEDTTTPNDFIYGKFKRQKQMIFICNLIHDFIDFDTMDEVGYCTALISRDRKEFSDMILDWDAIDTDSLRLVFAEILYYIDSVKRDFVKKVVDDLEILEVYDEIKLSTDPSKTKTYKKYKDKLSLSYNMITLQSGMEYSGEIVFKENIGKAFSDFSWREKELRKLYTKKKHDFENFAEAVKGKISEDMTEAAKLDKN